VMPRTYNEGLINCPFYKATATQSISCEGITDDCITKLLFTSPEKRDLHRKIYCDNQYKKCEIYNMLVKKYEE
jgi:hypothetical protein